MGAWPDHTAGSPCHRYSRPLAAIEVNDPPAVLSATRTVIKNKLHRSLPFLTTARQVSGADSKPARAPSQKREPSIEKLQNAGYRQERSTQAKQANVLSELLAVPERFATTAVTPQVPPTSASGAQVPQVAAKEERRVLHVRERRFERRDGVPERRAASTGPAFGRTPEPN